MISVKNSSFCKHENTQWCGYIDTWHILKRFCRLIRPSTWKHLSLTRAASTSRSAVGPSTVLFMKYSKNTAKIWVVHFVFNSTQWSGCTWFTSVGSNLFFFFLIYWYHSNTRHSRTPSEHDRSTNKLKNLWRKELKSWTSSKSSVPLRYAWLICSKCISQYIS